MVREVIRLALLVTFPRPAKITAISSKARITSHRIVRGAYRCGAATKLDIFAMLGVFLLKFCTIIALDGLGVGSAASKLLRKSA